MVYIYSYISYKYASAILNVLYKIRNFTTCIYHQFHLLTNSIPFEQFNEKTDEDDEEECIEVGFVVI